MGRTTELKIKSRPHNGIYKLRNYLFISLLITTFSGIAQRKNGHNHRVDIEESIVIKYIHFLDENLKNGTDTLLIENDFIISNLKNIKVKYVPSTHEHIDKNRNNSYLSISKNIHFESDTSLCFSISLKRNYIEFKKKKAIYHSSYIGKEGTKEYYVKMDLKTNKWVLQNTEQIDAQSPYFNESHWVIMDSTNVRQFINELRNVKNVNSWVNSITTKGISGNSWIIEEDLAFLISLLDSKEKSNCVVKSMSSQLFEAEDISTIGNQVTYILYCYIKGIAYPDRLNICPIEDQGKRQEILNWWSKKQ